MSVRPVHLEVRLPVSGFASGWDSGRSQAPGGRYDERTGDSRLTRQFLSTAPESWEVRVQGPAGQVSGENPVPGSCLLEASSRGGKERGDAFIRTQHLREAPSW